MQNLWLVLLSSSSEFLTVGLCKTVSYLIILLHILNLYLTCLSGLYVQTTEAGLLILRESQKHEYLLH